MKFYFVGIKGSGMASLALILKGLGHDIRGADIEDYVFTQDNLLKKQIVIDPFKNMHVQEYDYIVIGNSYLNQFSFKDKKIVGYQELIADLEKKCYSIAVCGTHGKTTTTNMIKCVLDRIFPCSYLIGDGQGKGVINASYFIYEACEHRDHFLSYHPNMIVCTNIDYDHVEYFKTKEQYVRSFYQFFTQATDHLILNSNIHYSSLNCTTYGYQVGDVCASNVQFDEKGVLFDLQYKGEKYEKQFLPLFGKTLFMDALACVACCSYLKIDIPTILRSLTTYRQATRRFNILVKHSNVIVDDYGHHPTEIKATLEAIKQKYPRKKIIIVYHPDRPKRLLTFLTQYKNIFNHVEKTYVLPFLKTGKEEQEALDQLINPDHIVMYTEDIYQKNYQDTIFLFTGSKEMNPQIAKLESHLE